MKYRLVTRVQSMAWGLLALLLSSCTTTNPNDSYFRDGKARGNVYVTAQDAIRKIAVLPFKAATELIGTSVSDMFVTELLRAGRYEMVERGQMANVLGETELALAGLSASRAAEVGQMLGADGVVIGTVDEYSTVADGGRTYPVVGIAVRLIDCKSGKIIWSADLAERAHSRDATLSEHGRNVVHAMTASLYRKWNK
jgi:curli biogenesis system outer membrane secretion channel CsgG